MRLRELLQSSSLVKPRPYSFYSETDYRFVPFAIFFPEFWGQQKILLLCDIKVARLEAHLQWSPLFRIQGIDIRAETQQHLQ